MKKAKTEAEKAADRLRRQQVKKRGERWQDALAEGFALMTVPHSIAKVEPPVRIVGSEGKGVFRVVFCKAGGADFEGGYRGVVTAIEAKDAADDHWYLAELDENQSERLRITHRQGGVALVALRMGAEDRGAAWALSWPTIAAMRDAGCKSVAISDMTSGNIYGMRIAMTANAGKLAANMTAVMEEALFSLGRGA